MEKEERWLETSLQVEDESRTSSPSYEAMDKSLKVGEDEWREKERNMKFYASNEVWTLKCNSQMIKVQKMHTHDLYLYPKCHKIIKLSLIQKTSVGALKYKDWKNPTILGYPPYTMES